MSLRQDDTLEGKLQLLIEAVIDYGIFILDPQGFVVSWNTGAQKLKGYTASEIIGRHFSTFYSPEAVASGWPEEELRRAVRDGRVEDEGWRIRKDGSRFWANVTITPIYDDGGALTGFAKVTRDLTERRAHEEQLRASEERFRLLVESVRDYAIFMLDIDGTVRSWNAGAQAIKGYTADEIVGRHFSAFYTPQDREAGKPEHGLRTAIAKGRTEDEGWRVRKDGSRLLGRRRHHRGAGSQWRADRLCEGDARHDGAPPLRGTGALEPDDARVPGDAGARTAKSPGAHSQRSHGDAARIAAQPGAAQLPRHHRPPAHACDAPRGRPAGHRPADDGQGQVASGARSPRGSSGPQRGDRSSVGRDPAPQFDGGIARTAGLCRWAMPPACPRFCRTC